MQSDRTSLWSRGVGSPARSCHSLVLLPAVAAAEPPRQPDQKTEESEASPAIELLPLRTRAKTHRASEAWRDIRPGAARRGPSLGGAPEPLSASAAKAPMCGRSVRGIRKPHAAYPGQA